MQQENNPLHSSQSIVVFGATGACGKAVVERCLVNGLAVTAFVRDKEKAQKLFGSQGTDIQIAQGDIANPQQIAQVLNNQTAAISCIACK